MDAVEIARVRRVGGGVRRVGGRDRAEWKRRVGPFVAFRLQLMLWVSAALVAIWISEQVRDPSGLLQ